MENLYNYIYITVNKLNGKCYVGSHASFKEHDYYLGSGNLINYAVKKYGKQNFLKIKLKNYNNILEARLNEGHYIEKFDTLAPNGYNISPSGGCNFKNGMASKETCEKLSKALKGRKHSEEHNKNVSKALEGRTRDKQDSINTWITRKINGNDIPWNKDKKDIYSLEIIEKFRNARLNKPLSEQTKDKQRKSMIGKHSGDKNPMAKISLYELWINKYGKEEADKRYKNWKEKISHPKKKRPYMGL